MQTVMDFLPRFCKNLFRLIAEVNLIFFKRSPMYTFRENAYLHGYICRKIFQKGYIPMLSVISVGLFQVIFIHTFLQILNFFFAMNMLFLFNQKEIYNNFGKEKPM